MRVSELVKYLQTCPQDALVLGRGYETGYDEIDEASERFVHYIPDANWYDGDYDYNSSFSTEDNISAILLT